jgi:hypothetical protein
VNARISLQNQGYAGFFMPFFRETLLTFGDLLGPLFTPFCPLDWPEIGPKRSKPRPEFMASSKEFTASAALEISG